jgi:primosomal replication protein N
MMDNLYHAQGRGESVSPLRFTARGVPVLNFSLHVTTAPTAHDSTPFVPLRWRCLVFGASARRLADTLHSGAVVTVTGSFSKRRYQPKSTAAPLTVIDLHCHSVRILTPSPAASWRSPSLV